MTNDLVGSIARLRDKLREMVLPPDPEGLALLCDVVPNLPDEVLELFKCVGGTQPHHPLYLMSAEKVARTVQQCREEIAKGVDDYHFWHFGDGNKYLLLFDDRNSNFLGLHLAAPLAPRGFVLDHDEPSTDPQFTSLATMIDAMCTAYETDEVCDCTQVRRDYPRLVPQDVSDEDRMLSKQFLYKHLNDKDDFNAAFAAIQLSDPDDMEQLMPLLASDDMWVSARICELVGQRKYIAGIARMIDSAVARGGNRITAAVVALRDWNDERAKSGLRALCERLGPECPGYFLQYLT